MSSLGSAGWVKGKGRAGKLGGGRRRPGGGRSRTFKRGGGAAAGPGGYAGGGGDLEGMSDGSDDDAYGAEEWQGEEWQGGEGVMSGYMDDDMVE
jgi:hypothetical protein